MRCERACAYGGGTVINAIATGFGAAFPISLRVTAEVCAAGVGDISVLTYADVDVTPVRRIVERLAREWNLGGVYVRILGDLPTAGGLKSSSATVNAIAAAMARLAGVELGPLEIARLNAELSKWAGISITGAFDDAMASITGHSYLTDNYRMEVIRELDVRGRAVVLIPPYGRGRRRADALRALAPVMQIAVDYARLGMWREAMLVNAAACGFALGYPPEPTLEALRAGAVGGVSGTGPAHVFVSDMPEELAGALSKYGRVHVVDIPQSPCAV